MTETTEAVTIPHADWDDFVASYFRWNQGEHLAMIGPTGQGKTNLALNLLPLRNYVIVFATKPRDHIMSDLKQRGYVIMKEWKKLSPTAYPRRVFWPKATGLYDADEQRGEFRKALEAIYTEGGWTVYLDETWFLVQHLKLDREVKTYLLQARSLNISLMIASQRPAWIPVETFDQSTHLFFFRDNDERNLSRISAVGFLSARLIRDKVAKLKQYQTLYINTRTGAMVTTMAPKAER